MKIPNLVECKSAPAYLPEALARRLDEAIANLPKDEGLGWTRKAVTHTKAVEQTERTDVSNITTHSVDMDADIVLADGLDTTPFEEHRTVLYEHDRDRLAGKNLWLKKDATGWLAKTYYPACPDGYEGEWLPDRLWAFVQADLLVGKSVGMLVTEADEPDEVQKSAGCRRVIKRAELYEYSCVSIPCNKDSIVQAINKGLQLDLLGIELKSVGRVRPKQPKRKRVEHIDRTAEFLRLVEKMALDPDAIAERVMQAMKNRGRVA